MSEQTLDTPRRFLTIDEVAAWLGIPKHTLYVWRTKTGYGPPAAKIGRHLRYSEEAVLAWAESQTSSSSTRRR